MPQETRRDCNGRCVIAFKIFPRYFGGFDANYTHSQYACRDGECEQGKLLFPEFLDQLLKSEDIGTAHIQRGERDRLHSNWARFERVSVSEVGSGVIGPSCRAVSDGAPCSSRP